MNVLVLGSGGREHALVWKIAQSPQVDKIYCAPGNPGIGKIAECVPIPANDIDALIEFARKDGIGLTVVGPEDPLARGIVDRFRSDELKIFGPTAAAARLESSKVFAKDFMARHAIPTAEYREFEDSAAAIAYIEGKNSPIVVKADGLAAGKGVIVAEDAGQAVRAVREIMVDKTYGEAGARVVIEERLVGEEASILAFSDGKTVIPMTPSQDHKPAYDGDEGPNTGGMGAYSPAPVVTPELLEEVERTILRPCIRGMAEEGAPFEGVLYAGLMITDRGPKVIEFNCRFGDPETQVVLPLLNADLVAVLDACCTGTLPDVKLDWHTGACVSVVLASGGYPRDYEKGKVISGIDDAESIPGVTVFHAGTAARGSDIITNGGRVLNVTATADSIAASIDKSYRAVTKITFEKMHYRHDIGQKALRRL